MHYKSHKQTPQDFERHGLLIAAVYSFLVRQCLRLDRHHLKDLTYARSPKQPCFDEKTVLRNGYVSAPSPIAKLVVESELRLKFGNRLRSVAGFYSEFGTLRLNFYSGLYLPVRGIRGQIVALQIHRTVRAKPLWLSSAKLHEGTPAKAALHYQGVRHAKETGTVLICDYTMRADLITSTSAYGVIALNGCGVGQAVSELRRELPEVKSAVIMFPVLDDESLRYLGWLLKELPRVGVRSTLL